MKKMMIYVCVLLLSIGFAYAEPISNPDSIDAHDNETVEISPNLKLIPSTKHEANAELYYTINAHYPQITGNNLSAQATHFNEMIIKTITEEIQQFKASVQRDLLHMKTLPEDIRKNTLDIDYDIDVIYPHQHQIISVRFNIEGMQAGRPHPFHRHRVINYDLKHGKELTLMALFKRHSQYLSLFSKYARTKLNKELQDKWLIANGTAPVSKNFTIWNLETEGVLITFAEYQVAPYVDGAPEVRIPYSALKNVAAADSPILVCINNVAQCERQN
jgi:hypothetical protein